MRSSFEGIFLESCNDGCRVKIQHKSIQVVAERIGLGNYLIRNDVAALRNFQCNVCLRKIKTLSRHALFEFLAG